MFLTFRLLSRHYNFVIGRTSLISSETASPSRMDHRLFNCCNTLLQDFCLVKRSNYKLIGQYFNTISVDCLKYCITNIRSNFWMSKPYFIHNRYMKLQLFISKFYRSFLNSHLQRVYQEYTIPLYAYLGLSGKGFEKKRVGQTLYIGKYD